ncbi:alpha beta hydrolase fold-3 domain protein [Colletotrichum kahawae]|uniref:Alpha beta hydrolase fold-3 domain protein n=1 Tax=Colletotrichum kahawae TaxID=34407 RepID=A0AAD9YL07_COLKA|nr:alpha beta hydrolase fold-3 domain protein [Colletotrichum kahawae]
MLATETMLPPRFRDMFRSREDNGDGTGQTSTMVRELEELLGTAVNTPWFSPIHLDSSNPEVVRNHPPKVFTYYTTLDPFRDDCLIYNKWLSELPGVESRTSVVENESHTAWVSLPRPECHSRKIKEVTLDGISWLLGVDWDRERSDLPT